MLTSQEQLEQWLTREELNNEPPRQATSRSEENNWQKLKKYLKDQDNKAWEEYWQGEIERNPQYSVIADRCDKGRLERYKNLTAAEAAIYVQIRTEKIGLNGFLKDMRVSNVNAECNCGWQRQTAKHIALFCSKWQDKRQLLLATTNYKDYSQLTDNKDTAKVFAKWFIGLNLLSQFKGRHNEE